MIILIFAIQSLFSIYNIIKTHPHQHVYFNGLANSYIKGEFALDYWGVSNSHTIHHLLENSENDQFPIKISSASFTDLNKTKLIIKKYDRIFFITNTKLFFIIPIPYKKSKNKLFISSLNFVYNKY